MKPEEKARQQIDQLLEAAGWKIQDLNELDLSVALGVAVREFPISSGFTDYMLFVDRKAVGVVEAKPVGTTLSGVAEQTTAYLNSVPSNVPYAQLPLPFAYETTSVETYFRDLRDPDSRSRRVFAFHKPETLQEWLSEDETLRARLRKMPPLIEDGLYRCQVDAVKNLETSFALSRPRALIQMATGSGKTYTAVNFTYRLIKHAKAKRVLFLVDRSNLGRQTLREFQQFVTPDDGRKLTELYNVQHMTSNKFDPVSRVCITTIQRLYSMLRGEEEFDEQLEEGSFFDVAPADQKPKEVSYNPKIPIETFDFIITDECHRSIYHLWRQVLEYFDGFIVGLTATPSKQTLGFFNNNLVMEYNHERAVADGVNVGYEVYRIRTEISEKGGKVEAGSWIDRRDRNTRRVRWEQLDDNLEYDRAQLDRNVVAPDQIRTIVRTLRDKLFTEIFPGRTELPKTLIFAKDDSHAEDIVQIVREEFGKGNDFCKKITYRTTGEKPEDLIASFRNSYYPRIAVTVDMISTGTDIKPLECLVFMRDVKSRVYFEQMKGRGTRVISSTDFKAVTPDANNKTHFVIVDAVGVCETDKTETRSLERKKGVSFEKLLMSVALGNRDEDTLTSLAGRLARLNREIDEKAQKEIKEAANDKPFIQIIGGLFDAFDPDKQVDKAKEMFKTETPTEDEMKKASHELAKMACEPFDSAKLRNTVLAIHQQSVQVIDRVSIDTLLSAGFDEKAKERSRTIVDTFEQFIERNKDELTALQIIYSRPYGRRKITYEEIRQLADAIEKPPYNLTTEEIWRAYEQLEKSKVRKASPTRLLTDIVSLVRFAAGKSEILESFPETVNARFNKWLGEHQQRTGTRFTADQSEWLEMIKNHIATSLAMALDDFELQPFQARGGAVRAYQLFDGDLDNIIMELNEVLLAS